MSEETQGQSPQNVLNVDAFMSGIKASIPPATSKDDSTKLQKIYLNAEPNQGKISFIPYSGEEGFYFFFTRQEGGEDNRVKELRVWNDDYETFVWLKILPKKFYGNLTAEQSAKYDEVVSLWQSAVDDEVLESNSGNVRARLRSYGLHYGYVLQHFNLTNQNVEDTNQGPSLIVAPSANAAKAFDDGISNKSVALGGNQWIPAAMNDQTENRKGYVLLSFSKATAGFGYSVGYNIEFSTDFSEMPPKDFVCKPEEKALFKSMIKDFMGWQNGEDGSMFSEPVFNDALFNLRSALGIATASPATSAETQDAPAPTPENGHIDAGSSLAPPAPTNPAPSTPDPGSVAPPTMPSAGGLGTPPPPTSQTPPPPTPPTV